MSASLLIATLLALTDLGDDDHDEGLDEGIYDELISSHTCETQVRDSL